MEINHDKCKILVNGEGPIPMIYIYDKQIENVENFKYLGAMLTFRQLKNLNSYKINYVSFNTSKTGKHLA